MNPPLSQRVEGGSERDALTCSMMYQNFVVWENRAVSGSINCS